MDPVRESMPRICVVGLRGGRCRRAAAHHETRHKGSGRRKRGYLGAANVYKQRAVEAGSLLGRQEREARKKKGSLPAETRGGTADERDATAPWAAELRTCWAKW